MCPPCQAEYDDPQDRRFHAQPNACPVCGPHLELWRSGVRQNAANSSITREQPRSAERSYEALLAAAQAIREGKIVAVKGLGGFISSLPHTMNRLCGGSVNANTARKNLSP